VSHTGDLLIKDANVGGDRHLVIVIDIDSLATINLWSFGEEL
jgi:hypothetical protein